MNARFRHSRPARCRPTSRRCATKTLRNQWGLTHALGYVLFTAAFVLLLVSILKSRPAEHGAGES